MLWVWVKYGLLQWTLRHFNITLLPSMLQVNKRSFLPEYEHMCNCAFADPTDALIFLGKKVFDAMHLKPESGKREDYPSILANGNLELYFNPNTNH